MFTDLRNFPAILESEPAITIHKLPAFFTFESWLHLKTSMPLVISDFSNSFTAHWDTWVPAVLSSGSRTIEIPLKVNPARPKEENPRAVMPDILTKCRLVISFATKKLFSQGKYLSDFRFIKVH
jgi:hypothetical protein